jgi:glutamate-1-semialdehyde 2,1-aminomutase
MRHFATYSRSNDCFPYNAPETFDSCNGCYAYADGKKYIDFGMGLRSVILGHAYPAVNEAVKQAIDSGVNYTRCNRYEDELRELMKSVIPCCEEVKFAKNGSDATSAAVKLARAYTGRDIVLIAEENPFISQHDWFISATEVDEGIPSGYYEGIASYSYNKLLDIEYPSELYFTTHEPEITRLEWLCNAYKPAAIILDAATVDVTREKLQYIRDLCDKYGIVMILDEVISGFRYDLGGVQKLYGVTPDLATFGKAMANGFSCSALCGKKELFDLGLRDKGNVFLLSGTYFNETTGLAAAIATIKELQDKNIPDYLNMVGVNLCEGLQQAINFHKMGEHIKFSPASRHCNPQLTFANLEIKTLFDQIVVENGVLAPYWAPSFGHGPDEIGNTVDAAYEALKVCKKAMDEGNVKDLLINGHCEKPVFRRT